MITYLAVISPSGRKAVVWTKNQTLENPKSKEIIVIKNNIIIEYVFMFTNPSMPGLTALVKSEVDKSQIRNLFDTETTKRASDVKQTPKTANWCPSNEYWNSMYAHLIITTFSFDNRKL